MEQQRELQDRNAALERQAKQQQQCIVEREQRIVEHEHRIEKLKWEIKELKRKLFGGTQGETVSDEQLQLALAELDAERREQEVSEKEVAGYTRQEKKDRDSKPRIPDHLEEVRVEIIPKEVQSDPDAWERIGEEVTEECRRFA